MAEGGVYFGTKVIDGARLRGGNGAELRPERVFQGHAGAVAF